MMVKVMAITYNISMVIKEHYNKIYKKKRLQVLW